MRSPVTPWSPVSSAADKFDLDLKTWQIASFLHELTGYITYKKFELWQSQDIYDCSYLLNIRGDPVYLFENNFPPSTSPFIYLERIFHPRHYGRLLILVNFPPSPPRFKRICPPSPFIRASPCIKQVRVTCRIVEIGHCVQQRYILTVEISQFWAMKRVIVFAFIIVYPTLAQEEVLKQKLGQSHVSRI